MARPRPRNRLRHVVARRSTRARRLTASPSPRCTLTGALFCRSSPTRTLHGASWHSASAGTLAITALSYDPGVTPVTCPSCDGSGPHTALHRAAVKQSAPGTASQPLPPRARARLSAGDAQMLVRCPGSSGD